MTPLDTLKAGLKTAIVTLLVGTIAVFTTLLGGLTGWAAGGNAPDVSNAKSLMVVLIAAAAVGLGNTALRYAQVAGPDMIAMVISKVLGAVPTYPEPPDRKLVTENSVAGTE